MERSCPPTMPVRSDLEIEEINEPESEHSEIEKPSENLDSSNKLNDHDQKVQQQDYHLDRKEPSEKTLVGSVRSACGMWFTAIADALPILLSVGLFMVTYYTPARILNQESLTNSSPILYDWIRGFVSMSLYHLLIIFLYQLIFSLRFSRKAIMYVTVPCAVVDVILRSIPQRKEMWPSLFVNLVSFLDGFISLYVIQKSHKPDTMTKEQEPFYQLTKDGTPNALFKGLSALFIFVGVSIQYFLPFLTFSSFMIQSIIRLLLFPMLFFIIKVYQTFVLRQLSEDQMNRRLTVYRVTTLYIKFVGRIILSNLSTGTSTLQCVMFNMVLAIADVLTTISFRKRTLGFFRIITWATARIFSKTRANRIVSIVPGNSNAQPVPGPQGRNAEEVEHLARHSRIRSMTISHEIGYEFIVAVVAPLLMFFVYPIYPTTSFNTISNINECMTQIFIQVFFVFVGDIVSLTYEIHYYANPFEGHNRDDKAAHKRVSTLLCLYSVTYTQYLISVT